MCYIHINLNICIKQEKWIFIFIFDFFEPALADGISLESKRQQIF